MEPTSLDRVQKVDFHTAGAGFFMNQIKENLRKEFLQKRKNLSLSDVQKKSFLICQKIIELDQFQKAHSIGLYSAIHHEVALDSLFDESIRLNKQVFFPKIIEDQLKFYLINSQTDLEKASFGILEPKNNLKLLNHPLSLLIVPGIVFNHQKYRIGYGKGFYDKILSQINQFSIGVGFDFQLVDQSFQDDWDQKVDMIITN